MQCFPGTWTVTEYVVQGHQSDDAQQIGENRTDKQALSTLFPMARESQNAGDQQQEHLDAFAPARHV